MSYHSLLQDGRQNYRSGQPKAGSQRERAKIFDNAVLSRKTNDSLYELPLISTTGLPKSPSAKATLRPFYAGINRDSFLHNVEHNKPQGKYIKIGNGEDSKTERSFSESMTSFCQYVRASGPARRLSGSDDDSYGSKQRFPTGWRLGTWVCCAAVILCVILEVTLLAYATRVGSAGQGAGILMIGNCKRVRQLELWLLLPLNIAGTMLIGASNYVMQVVSAPERAEIDRAHAYAQQVPVGGIRFRDLDIKVLNKSRQIIWWTLCLSSVPIHFLLNVAVFSSVQASNTGVLVLQDNFSEDRGWTYCNSSRINTAAAADRVACKLYNSFAKGQTKHYTASECLRQYSDGFQTNASSVIVVTDTTSQRWFNPPSGVLPLGSGSYGLPCRNDSSGTHVISDPGFNITYTPSKNSTQINMNFQPYCENRTIDRNQGTWKIISSDRASDFSFTSHDELVLQNNSILANITSIRAFFSAFQFRYWSSAQLAGDFARGDLLNLMNSKDPRAWICPREDLQEVRQCNAIALQQQNEWRITPQSMLVKECHVLPKQELCTLRYSSTILIITVCFELIKLSAMIAALKLIKRPLATLGDVIASFLRDPDPCTEICGPLTEKQALRWRADTVSKINALGFAHLRSCWGSTNALSHSSTCPRCRRPWARNSMVSIGSGEFLPFLSFDATHRKCILPLTEEHALKADTERLFDWLSFGGPFWSIVAEVPARESASTRWFSVPTRSRWSFSSLLFFPALAGAITYFAINFKAVLVQRLLNPWMTGFNAPDPNSMLTGWLSNTPSIYVAAMVVNSPQMAFSLLYFVFNATLTLMHTAHEWAKFSVERKALRVSNPRGQQRSTYWLQLPWSYSIPLILTSGGMHWLLSRSLYIVKVDMYDYFGGRLAGDDYFACGYSPVPALLLVVVLALMALTLFGLSWRKLPGNMPLVRLNSLAISSACHPNPAEQDITFKPLMFGTVQGYFVNGRPHGSFSAKPVVEELATWLEI